MKSKAEQLSEGIDHLTKLLADAEREIVQLQLGVSATIPLNKECTLTFDRMGRMWGLFVTRSGNTRLPIVKASKEERVLAAKKMKEMVAALNKVASTQLRDIQEATAVCEGILAAFRR